MNIQNKVVVVTGAGSGLGKATAKRLATLGATVIVVDMHADNATTTVTEIQATGGKALAVTCDVANEAQASKVFETATQQGTLAALINCAGIAPACKTLGKDGEHPLDLFAKVIQVNLIGTFNMLRLAAKSMANNAPEADGERGVIINTASVAAFDGQMGQAAYSASKAGVAGMTLPISRDLARNGIRVMTIAPGIFETPMLMAMSDEVRQSLGAQVPFPSRLGKPDEYASLVEHILNNVMLNGEVIRLDGAIRMAAK
jgi:NAD(P)-dependent dehydrogenase (short-subunit alcohol dehydrogenase family)